MSPAPTLTTLTSGVKAGGYGVALDDRLFRLVGHARVETAPHEAPRVNTQSSPEEFGETEPVFARSQFDGGEGLFRAHVEGAAANRFWDSKNVSVAPADPGEFPEVTLLHTTASIEATASETTPYSAYDGTTLYVVEGTVLRKATDPLATTPTFSDDDPHAGESATDVQGVAILGDEVYAALGANGIHRKSSGTWAHYNDLAATRVWSVKGRIVASNGVSLYEITASGAAPSPLKTLASGLEWTTVCDGGDFILAGATDGYVYAFGTDTGSMVLATQSHFEDEQVRAIGQSQGVILVGTRQAVSSGAVGRLYHAELDSTGQLANEQLIKQWGDADATVDMSPRRIVGTRDALFTAVPDGTDTYLWRYNLSPFGLARHLTLEGASGLVYGLHSISGKMFATVASSGVWRETSTYCDEGWLIGPLGDFHSSDEKSFVGARLETGTLSEGMTAKLYYTTDPEALTNEASSAWVETISRAAGSVGTGEQPISAVTARSIAGLVRITPNTDADATPAVRSFSFRAYPTSGDEDVIVTLDINVSDQIERPGLARFRVPGRSAREMADLVSFESKPVLLRIFANDQTIRGVVKTIDAPIYVHSTRGGKTLVSRVTVIGRRAGSGVTSGAGVFATFRPFGELPAFAEVA